MKSLFALIAVGLDAAATRFLSKIKETAAAVVVGVVGIGLLASPFLVLGNDEEEKTNDAPEVFQLYVLNSGSIGFEVKFDVGLPSDSDKPLTGFQLKQNGQFVERQLWVKRTSLYSNYCDWLEIPGFDGGPPLPYPGYNQYSPAFDFTIEGLELDSFVPLGAFPIQDVHGVASSVVVQLHVIVDDEGALESMSAWAYDSDGDSYEVSVYYSAGGGWDGSFNPF